MQLLTIQYFKKLTDLLRSHTIRLAIITIGFAPSSIAQTCKFKSTEWDEYPSKDLMPLIYDMPAGMQADTKISRPKRSKWLDYNNEGLKECKAGAINYTLNCSEIVLDSSMGWAYSKSGKDYKIDYQDDHRTISCFTKTDDTTGPAIVYDVWRYGTLRGTSIVTLIRNIYPVTFHTDDF